MQPPHRARKASSSRSLCSPFPDQTAGQFAPFIEEAEEEQKAAFSKLKMSRAACRSPYFAWRVSIKGLWLATAHSSPHSSVSCGNGDRFRPQDPGPGKYAYLHLAI